MIKYISVAAAALALVPASQVHAETNCYDETVTALKSLENPQKGVIVTPEEVAKFLKGNNPANATSQTVRIAADRVSTGLSKRVDDACKPLVSQNIVAFAGLGEKAEAPKASDAVTIPAIVFKKEKEIVQPIPSSSRAIVSAPADADNSVTLKPTVDLAEVNAKIEKNRKAIDAAMAKINVRPVAERSSEDIAQLNAMTKRMQQIETTLAALPKEGVVQKVEFTPAQQEALSQLDDVTATMSSLEKSLGRSLLDWLIIATVGMAAILLGLVFFVARKISRERRERLLEESEVKDRLSAVEEASGKAMEAIDNLAGRYQHSVEKITRGEHATLLPAFIRAKPEGHHFDYHVVVDGEEQRYVGEIVGRTPKKDVLVKLDILPKAVPAKSLFKALCDHIEDGGPEFPFELKFKEVS